MAVLGPWSRIDGQQLMQLFGPHHRLSLDGLQYNTSPSATNSESYDGMNIRTSIDLYVVPAEETLSKHDTKKAQ